MDAQVVETILQKHPKDPSSIIQVLLDIQNELYYLPRDVLESVSNSLNVPLSRTYSLATFYKAFSLKPKGKYPIAVCTGTACHVQGAVRILEQIERELSIKEGETTSDKKFSVESSLLGRICTGKSLWRKCPKSSSNTNGGEYRWEK
jgi:NADH-quinone oxidoreductase subunit E